MEIDVQALTTCEVALAGDAISLGFIEATGSPATIRLSLEQAGALLMTLPGLVDAALQRSFRDRSLRYTFPLASWSLEQSSDPTQCIVTLRTAGGFSVCFSIPRERQIELGEALAVELPRTAMHRAS
jgi:hypothetical protein